MSGSGPEVHRLVIVGGGPRATYALERLSADIGRLGPDRRLDVRIFERSGEFGSGEAHSPSQPTTSYLNRISGQVAFAADESVKDAGPLRPAEQRPTLHEWCRRRFAETSHRDFDLGPQDWPRRYVHGMALQDMFGAYLRDLNARPGVEALPHHAAVVDIEHDGPRLSVRTADGERFPADQVLLVTGHTHHEPRRSARTRSLADFADRRRERTGCSYVPYVYPLDKALPPAATGPGRVVGIAGMGLTAIDAVLHLTEGRGGVFVPDAEHGLRYRPSGAEPAKLLAFSGAGLFTFARPDNRKEADPALLEHRGVFLTVGAVDRLRAAVGTPGAGGEGAKQLDFERDVLPLVVLEMAHVHYATLFGQQVAGILHDRSAGIHRAFLAGGPPHHERPDDPARLLGPLEDAVDEIAAVLDGVLDDREPLAEAEARTTGWSVEAALLRWTGVVFGTGAPVRAMAPSPWRLEGRAGGNRFSWERTIAPLDAAGFRTPEAYRDAVLDFMDRDQLWALQGNLDNPHKAAADGVWRDLRPVISYVVDGGGLAPGSHRTFLARYVRVHNRLANGAAPEVMARIQALVRHGLLDVGAGPGAMVTPDTDTGRFRVDGPATGASWPVDTLVDARVHPFAPAQDSSPLFRNLLAAGTVRLWRNASAAGDTFEPGGLDLTDRFHPLRDDGTVEERVTVLGPPAEGRRSFLLSALRPDSDHYVMRESLTWLHDFWRLLEEGTRGY
ncbi:FAD/NAD(P)-binding protein [Streptomyces sp. RKAG337]|uniref:FAD/NAD(P)-binding protein n=1 Tax=Streptomyces sp. RKAG337 TaxID=2893404 RepID=UPI002034074E|nr:FAD/NAD(P)-binding protein [Streptomyces sp. RKAG337]MCM2427012.1 FAD/NAD(P)-binding protein [Streptomyces sp. RKAG337]